jgi:BRCA1-associated protein
MPSYFYHIALEILPDNPTTLASAASGGHDREHQVSLAFESACEAFLPFQKRYRNTSQHIIHSPNNSPLSISQVKKCREGNSQTWNPTVPLYASSGAQFTHTTSHCHPSVSIDSDGDGGLATRPPPSFHSNVQPPTETDLRFDKISIQIIDMVAPPTSNPRTASFSKRMMERRNQKEASHDRPHLHDEDYDDNNDNDDDNDNEHSIITTGIGTDILGGLHTRGRYIPLDQQLSDSVWGIVHLYRDAKETPELTVEEYPSYLKGSSAARHTRDELGGATTSQDGTRRIRAEVRGGKLSTNSRLAGASSLPDEDCSTLCILAVPSYLSSSDFLGFVGEGTRDDVSHFRMIRTARANRYMVLMKFRSGKKARDWQREWNGKVFNSMEVSLITFILFSIPKY